MIGLGLLKKYGPVLGFVAVLLLVLFIVKLQYDAKQERDALNNQLIEQKELADRIMRNQGRYVKPEDLENLAKSLDFNLKAIKNDLKKYDAEVKGISVILANSIGRTGSNIGSSWTQPRPTDPDGSKIPTCPDGRACPDPYGYLSNEQHFGLSEPFSDGVDVPIGSIGFSAWKEKPWSVNIHPRKYQVSTVLGQDEEGRHYIYNQMQIETDGEKHKVPISQAEFKEVYPESSFHFNPKIHLGIDVGAVVRDPNAEVVPNLQVSMFSYGRTKTNKGTEWSFLGVGAGYGTQTKSFNVLLTPVNYNLGQHIPLIESLHVGPTVSVDTNGDIGVLGGIRVGL